MLEGKERIAINIYNLWVTMLYIKSMCIDHIRMGLHFFIMLNELNLARHENQCLRVIINFFSWKDKFRQ